MRDAPSRRERQRTYRSPRAAWPNRGLAVALIIGAVLLGWWLPHIERRHPLGGLSYDTGAAQATLGAIASGIITLTGFVLTAVTLVIQSVQNTSPRLAGLLGFFEHSLVLFGALTGTAVYALVVLAQVSPEHVPRLSVTLAIVFVVLSTGATLATLAGLREVVTGGGLARAVGLRVHSVLDSVWESPEPPATARNGPGPGPGPGPGDPATLTAPRSGVVQNVDAPAIVEVAARHGVHVTCLTAVGSFVEPGAPLLRVTALDTTPLDTNSPHTTPRTVPRSAARRLTRAVRLGPSRHVDHDPAYGLRLLVDVAIRALSPAVNDPTTAVQSLDQIEAVLLRLAPRPLGTATFHDREGTARLTVPRPGWDEILDLALAEILHYGSDSLQVQRRLRALLDTLARSVPPARIAALTAYRGMLDRSAHTLADPAMTATATTPDPQGLGGPASTDDGPAPRPGPTE
ncbi:DUF2254 domain-containing protein [Streptomyces sp. NPDC091292]|uniref:DUF2254 domain-containing protein n=1 Tax=Streptomyces sp. NPDC091292 TaxID=3365991 RepID=UPI003825E2A0